MRVPARLVAPLTALALAAGAAQALELNRASQAELESLQGIGTALSQRLLDERAKAPFADWSDLMRRVPGIKAASASRLSRAGLTVAGAAYATPAAAPASAAR